MSAPKRLKARKLLVASVGVAAVAYVGCTGVNPVSGNLVAQPCPEAGCGAGGGGGGTADAGCTDGGADADAGCK